jgi:WD40 repeat protein
VAFAPNGLTLASTGSDYKVRLWDVASGTEVDRLLLVATSVAFNPNGTQLAAIAYATTLWSMGSGSRGPHLDDGGEGSGEAAAFSPDGTLIATAGSKGSIVVWDVDSGDLVRRLTGHRSPVSSVAFSPDGKHLASAAGEPAIKLWDVASGAEIRTLEIPNSAITHAIFSPDGSTLVSSSLDEIILVWDLSSGQVRRSLTGHIGTINSLAIEPGGTYIASASLDQTVKLWSIENGLLATLFGTATNDWVITSPDGRVDGSAGPDGGASLIYWQVGDIQLPGFVGWQRYHTPGLLGEVVGE